MRRFRVYFAADTPRISAQPRAARMRDARARELCAFRALRCCHVAEFDIILCRSVMRRMRAATLRRLPLPGTALLPSSFYALLRRCSFHADASAFVCARHHKSSAQEART